MIIYHLFGALAQLVAHNTGSVGVRSSNLLCSTSKPGITLTVVPGFDFWIIVDLELLISNTDSGSGGGKPPRISSGGNLVGGFLNRNERAVRGTVATIEVAEQEFESPGRLTRDFGFCVPD